MPETEPAFAVKSVSENKHAQIVSANIVSLNILFVIIYLLVYTFILSYLKLFFNYNKLKMKTFSKKINCVKKQIS